MVYSYANSEVENLEDFHKHFKTRLKFIINGFNVETLLVASNHFSSTSLVDGDTLTTKIT